MTYLELDCDAADMALELFFAGAAETLDAAAGLAADLGTDCSITANYGTRTPQRWAIKRCSPRCRRANSHATCDYHHYARRPLA
jgi:hypothetical protein